MQSFKPRVFYSLLTAAALSFLPDALMAAELNCPTPNESGHYVFDDGATLMQTGLAVNPDGASASYTPGDHGYTYISNGVNLIADGRKVSCSVGTNAALCRKEWARAEALSFQAGSPEFCVFAMEVEPLRPGEPTISCEAKPDRRIVGNGKGRPKAGPTVPAFNGGSSPTYASTTTLMHTQNNRSVYVDSGAIPGLVVPTTRPALVGSIAWVRYGEREGFAIVNDTGPAFGEGSVALHQLLRFGAIGPTQPIGPIPIEMRCSPEEIDLKPPFQSRPDNGRADRCRAGYIAKTPSDIRAYGGIEDGVTSIILAGVKPPMNGNLVKDELVANKLGQLAKSAGYTIEKLHDMAACLH